MDKYLQARMNMVTNQVMTNNVNDFNIIEAMKSIPRNEFVDSKWQEVAYFDGRIPIGNGRFMLSPDVFARMIQAAQLRPSDNVLDVACGTGYSTAVLSTIVSKVVAIESVQEFAIKAANILSKMRLINFSIKNCELFEGAPELSPFDAIIINGRVKEIPVSLIAQLREQGRLVCIEERGFSFAKAVLCIKYNNTFDKIDLFDAFAEEVQ